MIILLVETVFLTFNEMLAMLYGSAATLQAGILTLQVCAAMLQEGVLTLYGGTATLREGILTLYGGTATLQVGGKTTHVCIIRANASRICQKN